MNKENSTLYMWVFVRTLSILALVGLLSMCFKYGSFYALVGMVVVCLCGAGAPIGNKVPSVITIIVAAPSMLLALAFLEYLSMCATVVMGVTLACYAIEFYAHRLVLSNIPITSTMKTRVMTLQWVPIVLVVVGIYLIGLPITLTKSTEDVIDVTCKNGTYYVEFTDGDVIPVAGNPTIEDITIMLEGDDTISIRSGINGYAVIPIGRNASIEHDLSYDLRVTLLPILLCVAGVILSYVSLNSYVVMYQENVE